MLKIHRNYSQIFKPRFKHVGRHLELSPARSEDDELIRAIEDDHTTGNWSLDRNPDVAGLDEFWSNVVEDLEKDPDWFDFAKD